MINAWRMRCGGNITYTGETRYPYNFLERNLMGIFGRSRHG
jgi:hypothetical protein